MSKTPEIILAKYAGFCFGVDRAVKAAFEFAENNENAYSLGEVIHNNTIIEELKGKGVTVKNDYTDIPDGSNVIIRAHGVPKCVYECFASKQVNYVDATCPFVKKIHDLVSKVPKDTGIVLIAGDEHHPEVIGIRGFCECENYVFSSEEELIALLDSLKDTLKTKSLFVVSQTTFSLKEWEKCSKKIKLLCTNPTIFDTICKATEERQLEALDLSRKCDAMIVIGARHSSNTMKLFNLCSSNCKTCLIESVRDLDPDFCKGSRTIGVTAGASTPSAIIKEVLEAMSEVKNNLIESEEDFDFAEALEASLESMSSDQKVKGVIVGITPTEIQVDIGRKQTGYITYNEYSYDPTVDPATDCKVGDEINVVIMKTNDAEGTIMLSKRRFDSANSWDELETAVDDGTIMEGVVTDVVRGGLMVTTAKGVRVFVPASLATANRNDPIETLLKTKVNFKIIEVNKQRRRAVGSIKAVLRDARNEAKEKFWAQAEVGQVYTGVVKSITSYGVFIDIGGVDGMIHISELSWKRIKHPSEVLNIGDTVEVFIKALENNKISLGYKKEEDNPWAILKKKYAVGDIVDAKIVGMTTFGAFANIIEGIDGLIHISQIADRHIEKPQDALTVGEVVKAKITEIDFDKKRVSLSIRALIEPAALEEVPDEEVAEAPVEEPAPAPVEEAPVETPVEKAAPVEEAAEAPAEEAAE